MKKYKSTIDRIRLSREKTDFVKAKIKSSTDAATYIRQFYHEDMTIYESAFILLLNRSNNTIGYAKISQGGIAQTVIDAQIVAKYAIDTLATGVIIAHNHPSGERKPSESDREVTERIKKVLEIFGCLLLDHVILTEDDHFSFADEGVL